jgi:hypothetical protein
MIQRPPELRGAAISVQLPSSRLARCVANPQNALRMAIEARSEDYFPFQ